MDKPKLSPSQIIHKIKEEKGITFNYISESEAEEFLRDKNNYYRLASYRKNYDNKMFGPNKGKYINLDFAYLIDLSTIDMHIRFMIIKMCLDIEHDLKRLFLNDVTLDEVEDGYEIVEKFLELYGNIKEDIFKKRHSTYVGDLINKFFTFETHIGANGNTIFDSVDVRCPIWAFVEIISFGDFVKLFDFYYGVESPIKISLNPVKSLRNACAHNNCLINNLRSGQTRPGPVINDFVSKIPEISKDVRKKYLSVRPIFEFVNLLIVYNSVVSATIKSRRYEELKILVDERLPKHAEYYEDQQLLKASYKFIKKVVDFLV